METDQRVLGTKSAADLTTLTTEWNLFEIDRNQGDVVFLGAAIGSSGPAGQFGEECGEHGGGRERTLLAHVRFPWRR